jgi:hypothetical protein
MRIVLSLVVAVAAAQAPSIYGRSIGAGATISGSPKLRDGVFQLAGRAAICGEIPKEASMTGEATFVIELAGDTTGSMTTITFGAKGLAGRQATTSAFRLTVGVTTAQGGRPPHYVLNTDSPRSGNSGTATLTQTSDGAATLKIVGRNEANETIEFTATCR